MIFTLVLAVLIAIMTYRTRLLYFVLHVLGAVLAVGMNHRVVDNKLKVMMPVVEQNTTLSYLNNSIHHFKPQHSDT